MTGPVNGNTAKGLGRRWLHFVTVGVATTALLSTFVAGAGSAQGATPSSAPPLITKAALSPPVVAAAGGATTVRISVRNAATCWFEGMPGLSISSARQDCSNGTAKAIAHINRSDSAQLTHFHIAAWAAGHRGATATAIVYLVQMGLAPLQMTTPSLKAAGVAKHYSVQLGAKGGLAPYSWRLAAGELPIGLSLSPRGRLWGTPTTAGTYSISFQIADASRPQPLTTTAQLTLTIVPPRLAITTKALPRGEAPSLYTDTLGATGGIAPYSWQCVAGQLPPGLTLATTGVLSGSLTAKGTYPFVVRVTDAAQPPQAVTERVSLTVNETPIVDKTLSLPGVSVGSLYSANLTATGGISPYTWSIASGQLPDGITLSTAGSLAGTPTAAGIYKFVLKITDSSSIPQSLSVAYRLVVMVVPLAITTDKLPGGTIQSPYSAALVASGGTAPFSWGLTSGTLPPGITMSSGGELAGTPTQSGSFPISIKVTDSSPKPQTATVSYRLVVAPEPLLVATTALPGATVNSPYFASLTASGGTAPFTWRIVSGHLPAGITITSAGNLSGIPTAVAGTYPITFKVTDRSPTQQTASAPLALVVGKSVVNWSGYVHTGLYTSVTGTFIVPSVAAGQDNIQPAAASEWVGLDGVTRTGLIQAGVTEVLPGTGEPYCTGSGGFCIYPWWNISPGKGATPIVMTVSAGDSITVTIWQVNGSTWAITLDDNTTGQDFRTEQTYTGPGTTAEYVVDAPASVPVSNAAPTGGAKAAPTESIKALGDYTPSVQFTNLHTVGGDKSIAAVLLFQNGVQVSTPSVYTTVGFTVAYGSIVPTAP